LDGSRSTSSPVLREIVALGVDALPSLIAHLDDKRPTKVVFEADVPGQIVQILLQADEYDPRYRQRDRQPPGVNQIDPTRPPFRSVKSPTVSVGDLCFVAIGQIVNRNLSVVRYQPSGCIVINSPGTTRALGEAVKKDWAGLIKEEHRKSLVEDAERYSSL